MFPASGCLLKFYISTAILLQAIIITINILEPVKCWLTGRKEDRTGLVLYALSHWSVKSNMSRIRPEARSSMVGNWQTERGEGHIFCSFLGFGCFIIRVVTSLFFLFPSEIFLLLRSCFFFLPRMLGPHWLGVTQGRKCSSEWKGISLFAAIVVLLYHWLLSSQCHHTSRSA